MAGVTFERLPPERTIAAPAAASAGSCCCCCCCCLHTVGSVLGALSAKAPPETSNVPVAVVGASTVAPNYRVTKEYWATVLVVSTVVVPLYVINDFGRTHAEEWALLYAILFPAIQLGSSVIVAIRNAFSKRPGRRERLDHLGSITLRSFIGGLIGILVMVVLGSLMTK